MNAPWGVRSNTTAPGTRFSWANVATVASSALWSIGLSADVLAVELGTAVTLAPGDAVGVAAVCAARVGTVEHPASRRVAPITMLVARR